MYAHVHIMSAFAVRGNTTVYKYRVNGHTIIWTWIKGWPLPRKINIHVHVQDDYQHCTHGQTGERELLACSTLPLAVYMFVGFNRVKEKTTEPTGQKQLGICLNLLESVNIFSELMVKVEVITSGSSPLSNLFTRYSNVYTGNSLVL